MLPLTAWGLSHGAAGRQHSEDNRSISADLMLVKSILWKILYFRPCCDSGIKIWTYNLKGATRVERQKIFDDGLFFFFFFKRSLVSCSCFLFITCNRHFGMIKTTDLYYCFTMKTVSQNTYWLRKRLCQEIKNAGKRIKNPALPNATQTSLNLTFHGAWFFNIHNLKMILVNNKQNLITKWSF